MYGTFIKKISCNGRFLTFEISVDSFFEAKRKNYVKLSN